MIGRETRECLILLRTPLEKIKETVETILPAVHDHDTANRIAERAEKLIATAYEKDRIVFCGRKPSGIMASAIYLAARMENDMNISQNKAAKALGIAETTLRRGAHQINELLDLEVTRFPDRLERYVCPFCEEAFTALTDLKLHLWWKGIKASWALKVQMFNDDGVLVDEEILEKMRKYLE